MSLTIHETPDDDKTSFQIKWKTDWDFWMICEYMESSFGAIRNYAQCSFTIPNIHRSYLAAHLGFINQKIARETLQYLGRQPKSLASKTSQHNPTDEDLQRIMKTNPHFHRLRVSPFCWCFYNASQSIACKFCRFACCAKAVRQEMIDPVVTCDEHGQTRLEEDFSK